MVPIVDHGCALGSGDLWCLRIADVGQKNMSPQRDAAPGPNILYVENRISQVFIEDAWLHFKRRLRVANISFEIQQRRGRFGRKVQRVHQAKAPGGDGNNRNDAHKVKHAKSAGTHRSNFAIGSESAEAQQNADQRSHRNRDCKNVGQCEQY